MLRKITILFLFASLLGLVSCEYSERTEEVSIGVSSKDKELISKYEAGLVKEGIPYKVNTMPDGEIQILWDPKFSEKIKNLENSLMGLAPKNTEGLCFDSEKARERLIIPLQNNKIPYETRVSFDGMKCAYWDLAYDDSVAHIYPNWGEIRKLRKEMQSNKSLKARGALKRAP